VKKLAIWVVLGMLAIAPAALAGSDCPHGGDKGKCHRGSGYPKSGEGESQCPIIAKFMKKAHFFLANKQEIGFSDEQLSQIKALKLDMEKSVIRKEAEMKVFMLDMTQKLSEQELDVEGLNAMIDQGMIGMGQGAKDAVAAYAKLKSVPTADQFAKAKEIWQRDSQ
jgi:hypothetical protein